MPRRNRNNNNLPLNLRCPREQARAKTLRKTAEALYVPDAPPGHAWVTNAINDTAHQARIEATYALDVARTITWDDNCAQARRYLRRATALIGAARRFKKHGWQRAGR